MSSGISLSRSESASAPLSVNSKLETYPPQHPEKSMIFLGTRLTPFPWEGKGELWFPKGLFTPQKLCFCGDPV
jgi:hypothetical protein